jgi:DNA-binding CsgD family transcriptional regulator/predicted ester cyclase
METGVLVVNIIPQDFFIKHFMLPLWNKKSLEIIDTFIASTAKIQTSFLSGVGPEVLKQSARDTFQAFPILDLRIESIFQAETLHIYQWQASAVHEGSIIGIPKTGLEMFFKGILLSEMRDGYIIRYESYSNISQVLRNHYETFRLDPQTHVSTELRKLTNYPLTRREVECLSFWLKGCSIKETAKQMGGLSARTVQTYRENIKKKFNIFSFQKIFCSIQKIGIMPLFLESQYAIRGQEKP